MIPLTKPQKAFLLGYIPDIEAFIPDLSKLKKDTFIESVSDMDFDGEPGPGGYRVASNLEKKGLLERVDRHDDVAGSHLLYIEISEKGAEAIYEIFHESQPVK